MGSSKCICSVYLGVFEVISHCFWLAHQRKSLFFASNVDLVSLIFSSTADSVSLFFSHQKSTNNLYRNTGKPPSLRSTDSWQIGHGGPASLQFDDLIKIHPNSAFLEQKLNKQWAWRNYYSPCLPLTAGRIGVEERNEFRTRNRKELGKLMECCWEIYLETSQPTKKF